MKKDDIVTFYMIPLIGNQVKTNMCSGVLTNFVPLFTLNCYNNNYNNNCLFEIKRTFLHWKVYI